MLKLAAIFTQGAVEFDGGERFTGSGSCDLIKTLHAKAIRLVWTVQGTDAFAVETHRIVLRHIGEITALGPAK